MKKIEATICDENATWKETYDVAEKINAEDYMNAMIENFNSSIRENERKRKLVGLKVIHDTLPQEHQWEKTNIATIHGRGSMYDTYKCKICGITGRRYGIGNVIKRDRKYIAKCYDSCESAIKHLKKLI